MKYFITGVMKGLGRQRFYEADKILDKQKLDNLLNANKAWLVKKVYEWYDKTKQVKDVDDIFVFSGNEQEIIDLEKEFGEKRVNYPEYGSCEYIEHEEIQIVTTIPEKYRR